MPAVALTSVVAPNASPHPSARILLAVEEPMLRDSAAERLAEDGHAVTCLADGAAMWSKLHGERFDLAILDLNMPEVEGFALIQDVRRLKWCRDMPVIVIASRADSPAIDRAFADGATALVIKPVNWTSFSYQVRFALRSARAEAELRAAKEQAESVNRLRARLLSIINHEYRTPLHSILGFSELLRQQTGGGLSAASVQEYAWHIYEGGQRFCRALDDIMTFSRLLSGDIELDRGRYPLRRLLEDAAGAVSKTAAARGIEIKLRVPEREVALSCDHARMRQALSALIENAVTFSPRGSPVEVVAEVEPDGSLIVAVADRGPGMTPECVGMHLEPLVRDDMPLGRTHEGLGLGLPLAKRLIELHGARLIVQSTLGTGTSVAIVIPADQVSVP